MTNTNPSGIQKNVNDIDSESPVKKKSDKSKKKKKDRSSSKDRK